MKGYRIGIDVGGTNTDCVIVNADHEIVAKTKQPTTTDVSSGIANALSTILKTSGIGPENIQHVMLGTSQCTNAIVERKQLSKVGIIRICKPASVCIPPLSGFPGDMAALLKDHVYMVHGGFEYDGRPIHPLDEEEVRKILNAMKSKVDSVAISGIFSKINPEQEQRVADLAREVLGAEIVISMSYQIGSLGLLERENATILNAMLHKIAEKMTLSFRSAVKACGVNATLHIGQNDGTLMSLEKARQFPVLTIASGPTNSIRGAGALSGIKEGIVIDVGGTTSDAGVLVKQFPRESSKEANIGGIRTNFRMPDVVAVGLGGGTIIHGHENELVIGPKSVGHRVTVEAYSFGGDTYTLSDYAILNNKLEIPKRIAKEVIASKIENTFQLDSVKVQSKVKDEVLGKINQLVDKVKTDNKTVPLIAVGGGSSILPDKIEGVSEVIQPHHYEVANAYGACIAQVSGESERVFNLDAITREEAIKEVRKKAVENAIASGAKKETIETLLISDTPLAYLPNALKVSVKVCGDLNSS